ncbi:hypothetical protein ABW19_dt0203511 [Dactylella cylindrospora]|nr:hypothetical protein ABW19_dt0203511 [Dactylella cylindrospora]
MASPVNPNTRNEMRKFFNRCTGRNVLIFSYAKRDFALGGLQLAEDAGITNANFYQMVDILLGFDLDPVKRDYFGPWDIIFEQEGPIARDLLPLKKGVYFIRSYNAVRGSFYISSWGVMRR